MGCICQSCQRLYKVDFLVPDYVWEEIKPEGRDTGAGLLCGICIITRLEHLGGYGAWKLYKV